MTSLRSVSPSETDAARRARARIPLEVPTGLLGRVLDWYSRRAYGRVPDPGLAFWHHRPVLFADLSFERKVARWRKLDPQLKALAVMAAAIDIECRWCVDFGYFVAHGEGLDLAKVSAVATWRDSDLFNPLERDVIDYAQAATATPPRVTDELVERIRKAIGNPALVELTMIIAVENQRSRFNAALGLSSQGFSDSCRVPVA